MSFDFRHPKYVFNGAWGWVIGGLYEDEPKLNVVSDVLKNYEMQPEAGGVRSLSDYSFADRSYSGDIYYADTKYDYIPAKVLTGFKNIKNIIIGEHIEKLETQCMAYVTCDSLHFNDASTLRVISDYALYEINLSNNEATGTRGFITTGSGDITINNAPYIGIAAFGYAVDPEYNITIHPVSGGVTIAQKALASDDSVLVSSELGDRLEELVEAGVVRVEEDGTIVGLATIVKPTDAYLDIRAEGDVVLNNESFLADPRKTVTIHSDSSVVLGGRNYFGVHCLPEDPDVSGSFESSGMNVTTITANRDIVELGRAFSGCLNLDHISFSCAGTFSCTGSIFTNSVISSEGRISTIPETSGIPYGISIVADTVQLSEHSLYCAARSVELASVQDLLLPRELFNDTLMAGANGHLPDGSFDVRLDPTLVATSHSFKYTKNIRISPGTGKLFVGDFCFCGESNIEFWDMTDVTDIIGVGNFAFYEVSLPKELSLPLAGDIGMGSFAKSTMSSVNIKFTDNSTSVAVGDYSFFACPNLSEVVFDVGGVYSIGERTFKDCPLLASANISEGCLSIGEYAFMNTALPSIVIPDTVLSVGIGAFFDCSFMTQAKLSENMTILNPLFRGTCIESIDIPESVTTLANECFFEVSSLSEVSGCEGVTSIGDYSFAKTAISENCVHTILSNLGNARWGKAVFHDCPNLVNVTIPAEFSELCISMFSDCRNLETLTVLPAAEKLTLTAGCLSGTGIHTIYRKTEWDRDAGTKRFAPIEFKEGWMAPGEAKLGSLFRGKIERSNIKMLTLFTTDVVEESGCLGAVNIGTLNLRGGFSSSPKMGTRSCFYYYLNGMKMASAEVEKLPAIIQDVYCSYRVKPGGYPWGAKVSRLHLGEEYYALDGIDDGTVGHSGEYVYDDTLNRTVLQTNGWDIHVGDSTGSEWALSYWATGYFLGATADSQNVCEATWKTLGKPGIPMKVVTTPEGYIRFVPTTGSDSCVINNGVSLLTDQNSWNHYMFVNSPNDGFKTYVNGVLISTSPSCDWLSGSPITIPAYGNVRCADIHIFNRTPLEDEIKELSKAYPISTLDLRSVLSFDGHMDSDGALLVPVGPYYDSTDWHVGLAEPCSFFVALDASSHDFSKSRAIFKPEYRSYFSFELEAYANFLFVSITGGDTIPDNLIAPGAHIGDMTIVYTDPAGVEYEASYKLTMAVSRV